MDEETLKQRQVITNLDNHMKRLAEEYNSGKITITLLQTAFSDFMERLVQEHKECEGIIAEQHEAYSQFTVKLAIHREEILNFSKNYEKKREQYISDLFKIRAEEVQIRAEEARMKQDLIKAQKELDAAREELRRKIPEQFCDMIFTLDVMEDPVVATDGFTYERRCIEKWFSEKKTSPTTNAVLTSIALIPNNSLRSQINQWREKMVNAGRAGADADTDTNVAVVAGADAGTDTSVAVVAGADAGTDTSVAVVAAVAVLALVLIRCWCE